MPKLVNHVYFGNITYTLILKYFLVIYFSKLNMGLVSLLFVLINFGNSFINTDYNTKRCSRKERYYYECSLEH